MGNSIEKKGSQNIRKERSGKAPWRLPHGLEGEGGETLEQLLQPGYQKTRHGPVAAERVTLAAMERECLHFRLWMEALRNLGGNPL